VCPRRNRWTGDKKFQEISGNNSYQLLYFHHLK
jgi:hypothetical protein